MTPTNPKTAEVETSLVQPAAREQAVRMGGLLIALAASALVLYLRNGPHRSSAAVVPAASLTAPADLVARAAKANAEGAQIKRRSTTLLEQLRQDPTRAQVSLSELNANPFRGTTLASIQPQTAGLGNGAQPRGEDAGHNAASASQLPKLQNVLEGNGHRACLIDNTLLQEGQEIDGFIVERITPRTVVIRKGDDRIELKLDE